MKSFIILACITVSLTLLALSIGSDAYFRENQAAEPQPLPGRIHATKLSKGVLVYLTRKEQIFYQLLMPTGAVFIIMGLLLTLWWKQFPERGSPKRLRE